MGTWRGSGLSSSCQRAGDLLRLGLAIMRPADGRAGTRACWLAAAAHPEARAPPELIYLFIYFADAVRIGHTKRDGALAGVCCAGCAQRIHLRPCMDAHSLCALFNAHTSRLSSCRPRGPARQAPSKAPLPAVVPPVSSRRGCVAAHADSRAHAHH